MGCKKFPHLGRELICSAEQIVEQSALASQPLLKSENLLELLARIQQPLGVDLLEEHCHQRAFRADVATEGKLKLFFEARCVRPVRRRSGAPFRPHDADEEVTGLHVRIYDFLGTPIA